MSMRPEEVAIVDWNEGRWRNTPVDITKTETGALAAEAAEGSDAWRKTSYGFVRDSEHALLRPFAVDSAVEVQIVVNMSAQFEQAGVLIRLDSNRWIKAGLEYVDGALRLSTVVTDDYSDWSTAAVPQWLGRRATVRASWADETITVRARVDDEPFELARVAPWKAHTGASVVAGPYLCAPTSAGFRAEFIRWSVGSRDDSLH